MDSRLLELEKRVVLRVLKERKEQKVWEWIEEHCQLPKTSGSRVRGQVDTSMAPYSRWIYDAFGDPRVRFITLVKSAQVGGTTILKNLICYDVSEVPGPQLYVTSTGAQADRFNDRELEPHFKLCEPVESLAIRDRGQWTKSEKVWKNGATLGLVGSNSVSQLASRTVERLFMDETDKWPSESEKEAAADDLAEARTKTYEGTRKVFAISTPTIESGRSGGFPARDAGIFRGSMSGLRDLAIFGLSLQEGDWRPLVAAGMPARGRNMGPGPGRARDQVHLRILFGNVGRVAQAANRSSMPVRSQPIRTRK